MLSNINLVHLCGKRLRLKSVLGLHRLDCISLRHAPFNHQFSICLQTFIGYKTTFKLNRSPQTRWTPRVWWCVVTCWKSFVACGSGHSGWAATRPAIPSWQGAPAWCQQMIVRRKNFPPRVFICPFFSFSICGSRCGGGICSCSLNARSFFSSILSGSSTSQGDNQANGNQLINQAQIKERIVQNIRLSPTHPRLDYFISVSVYSLWLVFDHRGDHHPAGLQGIVAAPPGLPEDALLPLVPLLWRRALEVSAVQVGATAVTEPPAT